MNYQTFQNIILEKVQQVCSKDVSVRIHSVKKNNGQVKIGITWDAPTEVAGQVIYLDSFFASYQHGVPLDIIAADIHEKLKLPVPEYVRRFSCETWEQVRERVVFRLVNRQKNEDACEELFHRPFLDLEITYGIYFEEENFGQGITVVTKRHGDLWQVDEETVYQAACNNTAKLLPERLWDLMELVQTFTREGGLGTRPGISVEEVVREGIYVLSNAPGFYGATVMIYSQILPQLAQWLGEDIYVLPCSIHELIITTLQQMSVEELEEMVRETNARELAVEDVLSDHVYCYSFEKGELILCESQEKGDLILCESGGKEGN